MSISRSQPGWSLFSSDPGTMTTVAPAASSVAGGARQSRNPDAFAGEVRGAMAAAEAPASTRPVMGRGEMRGNMNAGPAARPNTVGEVREALKAQNQVLSPEAEFSLAKASAAGGAPVDPSVTPVDRLQHRALSALNTLTGGGLDGMGQGLSSLQNGMRGILLNGGSLKRARGIDLVDRTAGIALDPDQRRTLEQATFNRARKAEGVTSTTRTRSRTRSNPMTNDELGKLAARFESGSEGIAAIGYDRVGGTSYGKYQIASRPGSVELFLNFLDANDPAMAERLRAAGPANTGSTKGEMPTLWREIAAEDPQHFEKLQEQFIHESHYQPALAAVRRAGYNTGDFSPAMKEVLFSTAVQHGPMGASRIFEQAADNVGLQTSPSSQKGQEKAIISEIYSLRANRFGSSTPQIQAAAKRRMEEEKYLALAFNQ